MVSFVFRLVAKLDGFHAGIFDCYCLLTLPREDGGLYRCALFHAFKVEATQIVEDAQHVVGLTVGLKRDVVGGAPAAVASALSVAFAVGLRIFHHIQAVVVALMRGFAIEERLQAVARH